MATLTVQKVYELIDEIAPFEQAEAWDNVGILAGRRAGAVEGILIAMDVTRAVVREANSLGANLIVTHHPILFNGRKNLLEDEPESAILCELVRSRISVISAHTNLDVAPGGVNDALCEALNLRNVTAIEEGLRIGDFSGSLSDFLKTAEKLGGLLRRRGATKKENLRICVCGGAGGSFWSVARDAGADVYITGEMRHFDALCAVDAGLTVIEAGHEETEGVVLSVLADRLQKAINDVQYNVMVYKSALSVFSVDHGE